MDSMEVLDEISENSGKNWSAEDMLEITTAYIDNQEDPQTFRDFVKEQVVTE